MSLAKGQLIETITLEEALRLFDLPRVVGTHNGEEIVCAIGRFGPYIRYKGSFISLGKDNDPHTISLEKCITLIDEHSSKEAKKSIKSFAEDGIEILNGRFGAYIKKGKNNYKIPKGVEPESIDLEKAIEIIAKADTGGKTRKKK